eukprot:3357706-Pleurochrysis_carterae.AAC.1
MACYVSQRAAADCEMASCVPECPRSESACAGVSEVIMCKVRERRRRLRRRVGSDLRRRRFGISRAGGS